MTSGSINALSAECVIFDLDGTLVDTAPDLLATLNVIFKQKGHREITLAEIRTVIGHGARAMIREGGELTGNAFSDDEIEEMFADYLEIYSDHIADRSTLFPGGAEVLEALDEAGVKMAICTNKLESLTHMLLKALDIDHYFAAVIGSDTLSTMKPDPAGIFKILDRTGAEAAKSLFVGDSPTDFKAARNAGVPVVLVDYGYTAVPATTLDPDAVISNLKDLL